MKLDRFTHPNLKIPTAIACAFGLAIGLAMAAGSGEFRKVGMILGVLFVAAYILFFQQHTWKVALFFCFTTFMHTGLGFTMGDMEISLVLAGLLFATTWWQKHVMERPPTLDHWSFGWFNAIAFLWLAYVFAHTLFNIYLPYRPQDFAFKNLIRTTEIWSGPLLLALYFSIRPRGIQVRANFPQVTSWLLLMALCVNILVRLWSFVTGRLDHSNLHDATDQFLTIPIIGLVENVYALRGLCPLAMLFTGAFTATRWFAQQTRGTHRLFYAVMALSVVGATMSGGRATLAATLGLLFSILFIRRRFGMLFACFGAFVFLFAVINVIPDTVRKAPPLIRRSLNWALLERDVQAGASIAGSSDWRLNLFKSALDEWRSDPRIFWFGRSTYSYNLSDMTAILLLGEEGKAQSALRRGTTHNMITDLLIIFGLCGLVLYFVMVFSFLHSLWAIYRSKEADELGRTLALVVFMQTAYIFGYGLLGGGQFPAVVAWLYVVLIAWLYHQHRRTLLQAPEATAAVAPVSEPRRRLPRRRALPTRF